MQFYTLGIHLFWPQWSFLRLSIWRLLRLEVTLFGSQRTLGADFSLGDDLDGDSHNAQVSLRLPWLLSFFASFTLPFLRTRFRDRATGAVIPGPPYVGLDTATVRLAGPIYGDRWPRSWGGYISFDGGGCVSGPHAHISLGAPRSSWTRGDWSWGCFPLDVLLGRHVMTSEVIFAEDDLVMLPEKHYPCTVEVTVDTWKRPRWPFPLRLVRFTVAVEGGVPVPGKGENSWDCGKDATHSLSGCFESADPAFARALPFIFGTLAVSRFTSDVEKTRTKRGWKP